MTNKDAHGKKGAIVAIVKGTNADDVIKVIKMIEQSRRNMVKEVTVDMAANMNLIIKKCFLKAEIVTDRFHVQKLATEAVQEERIRLRWEVLDQENTLIGKLKKKDIVYSPEILINGGTKRQLLARSRYLLFKHKSKWTPSQITRAELLFKLYLSTEKCYNLAQQLSKIYQTNTNKDVARLKLAHWYENVQQSGFKSFNIISKSLQTYHNSILNYFNIRSTNASAESFNAKIKEFRAQFRGVRDVKFFLFRLTKLYA